MKYARAEEFFHTLTILNEKIDNVRNICGSGFIHDARQNYRNCQFYLREINEHFMTGESLLSMFDYDLPGNPQFEDREFHFQTETAFNNRLEIFINKCEKFLEDYATFGDKK